MLKKIKTGNEMKLYCVYDKVAQCYRWNYSAYCHTDQEYCFNLVPLLMKMFYLKDIEFRELYTVDGSKYRVGDWSCYRHLENKSDAYLPLGFTKDEAEAMINEKKLDTSVDVTVNSVSDNEKKEE